jgi:hypothetical protein
MSDINRMHRAAKPHKHRGWMDQRTAASSPYRIEGA